MSAPGDEDLAERVADLEEALRELQDELTTERRGLPRPPSPVDILRFTDEYGIPATIAFLEAHIRALELLQGMIRLAGVSESERSSDRQVERVSRSAIKRLDAVVSDLRATPLPQEPEARELIEEAQDLRDELADRMDEAHDSTTPEDAVSVDIDVDEELDAIKSDVRDDDEDDDQPSGENR